MNDEIKEKPVILPPFKHMIMTIGELPSSYVETMTYYEMLVWFTNYLGTTVIPAINQNGEAVIELQELFVNLQDYVNDYFNNLDVQNEIDNKLDEMSIDGSLTNLIKNYIDPIQEEFENHINGEFDEYKTDVNNHIATMNTKINNITSGTPIPVSSTSDMVDTTRIYLNTTDGYWYYYNGTAWTQGELYQSMGINPSSVTYDSLTENLKGSLDLMFKDDTVYDDYQSGYLNSLGQVTASPNNTQFYLEVDLSGNEIFYYKGRYDTVYMTTTQNVYFIFDENDEILYKQPVTEALTGNDYEEVIICPPLARKIVFNITLGRTSPNVPKYVLTKLSGFIQKEKISYDQLDNVLKTLYKPKYEVQENTLFLQNAYFDYALNPNTYAGWNIYEYNVTPYSLIEIEGLNSLYSNPTLVFTTKDVSFTKEFNLEELEIQESMVNVQGDGTTKHYTVPPYCTKIYCVVAQNNTNFKFKVADSFVVDVENTDIDISSLIQNPLDGKVICFLGDSITAASTSGVKGYVAMIQENNPNSYCYNYAHDGNTIGKRDDSIYTVQRSLPTILSEHPDADYIIIQGGINDIWQSTYIPKGSMSSSYNESTFDRYTFAGGLEYIINYFITNFPNVKLAYITTHKVNYLDAEEEYMNLAKEICAKWAVPVIDVFNEGNLNLRVPYEIQNYSIHTQSLPNGDGTHPNLDGYKLVTPLIENGIKYKL